MTLSKEKIRKQQKYVSLSRRRRTCITDRRVQEMFPLPITTPKYRVSSFENREVVCGVNELWKLDKFTLESVCRKKSDQCVAQLRRKLLPGQCPLCFQLFGNSSDLKDHERHHIEEFDPANQSPHRSASLTAEEIDTQTREKICDDEDVFQRGAINEPDNEVEAAEKERVHILYAHHF